MFTIEELERAHRLVRSMLPETLHYAWPTLAARVGTTTWIKHENHLPTGAFKVRGGLVHVERLAREGLAPNGLISATRGNHGQSLALAGRHFGVPVTIVVPRGNSVEKNDAMRAFGATLIEHGNDFDAAKVEAVRLADEQDLWFAPSFHRDLVTGVATWAYELLSAAPDIDILYVPIGLGSSICGAIRVRDLLGRKTEIVGVQSTHAPAYARSLEAGEAVEIPSADTRADGLAVRIPDPAALDIIRAGVSRIVTVNDAEIADAVRAYWADTHNLAEGAGAAALAAVVQERDQLAGRCVGLPLSGGNIDLALFSRWILAGD
ncbi:threonine dehydratase [Sphingomonas lycopersici]|uniref:Threonine dehydratase n=1 Tax=Sphingomonas lycopersici TaxID=2951807 RepID=A0AA41ZEE6_9SPHN|nr:threonine dehydratase [Sphingomonas lycopersici]MCW6535389.1 threonine dehydratase [Sphingomonas lycopersici]